ncbi:hypothetical protein QTP86_020879, partial [Hemibagrus guttatus]
MNKNHRVPSNRSLSSVEVKSKFGAEFRRFSLDRSKPGRFDEFYGLLQHVHRIPNVELLVGYADIHGDLLPINNDDNYHKAITTATPLLRLFLQRKEEADYSTFGTNSLTRKKPPLAAVLLRPDAGRKKPAVVISLPRDFRPVSSIIDVDVLPETHRRVRLYKYGQEKPLGFYIRDGSSVRVTPHGLEKAPGIFISRLVPWWPCREHGPARGQRRDMMIANSHNLIITVKPANQRNNVVRHNNNNSGAASGSSGRSSDSGASYYSYTAPGATATTTAHIIQNFHPEEVDSDEDDEDLVLDAGGDSRLASGSGTEASTSMSTLPRYKPHLDLRNSNGTFQPSVMSSTGTGSLRGSDR